MANVHWLKKINKGTSWPQFRQLWVAGMGDRCLRSSSQNGKTDSCFQSGGQERERKVVWGAKFKNDWPGQGEKHAWLTIADSCGKTEQALGLCWDVGHVWAFAEGGASPVSRDKKEKGRANHGLLIPMLRTSRSPGYQTEEHGNENMGILSPTPDHLFSPGASLVNIPLNPHPVRMSKP